MPEVPSSVPALYNVHAKTTSHSRLTQGRVGAFIRGRDGRITVKPRYHPSWGLEGTYYRGLAFAGLIADHNLASVCVWERERQVCGSHIKPSEYDGLRRNLIQLQERRLSIMHGCACRSNEFAHGHCTLKQEVYLLLETLISAQLIKKLNGIRQFVAVFTKSCNWNSSESHQPRTRAHKICSADTVLPPTSSCSHVISHIPVCML